jgi:hypothetical protein
MRTVGKMERSLVLPSLFACQGWLRVASTRGGCCTWLLYRLSVPGAIWCQSLIDSAEVCRALSGQASGLALVVRPAGAAEAPGSMAMRSTVEAGGAVPDNARHSGPPAVTFARRSVHLARG